MKYRLSIVENVSKNGKPYKQLVIEFENGYKFTTFLNNEQHFILSQLLEK